MRLVRILIMMFAMACGNVYAEPIMSLDLPMHFDSAKNILGQVRAIETQLSPKDADDLLYGVDEILSALPINRPELKGREEEVLLAILSGSTPREVIRTAAILKLARVKYAGVTDDPAGDLEIHLRGDTEGAIASILRIRKLANQRPEGTPGKSSPSNPSPVPVVPHP